MGTAAPQPGSHLSSVLADTLRFCSEGIEGINDIKVGSGVLQRNCYAELLWSRVRWLVLSMSAWPALLKLLSQTPFPPVASKLWSLPAQVPESDCLFTTALQQETLSLPLLASRVLHRTQTRCDKATAPRRRGRRPKVPENLEQQVQLTCLALLIATLASKWFSGRQAGDRWNGCWIFVQAELDKGQVGCIAAVDSVWFQSPKFLPRLKTPG